jgi:hypothetical protein
MHCRWVRVKNALLVSVANASASMDRGNVHAVCGQLGAFISKVRLDVTNGLLTRAQGQPLIDAATAIRAQLGCGSS